jgi:hypothetical protein
VVRFTFTPKKKALLKIERRLGGSGSVFGCCGEKKTLFSMTGIETRYLGCPVGTVAAVLIDLPPTNVDTITYSTLYPSLNDKSNWLTTRSESVMSSNGRLAIIGQEY